ncbi:MAG: DUF4212 domain-containing protein [Phycisphaerales bacterium JB040]
MTDPNDTRATSESDSRRAYWHANLRIVGALLAVWALVSYGCGILFKDWLDRFTLPGTHFPLGFWFAQQGAIYTFVVLIFVYVFLMNRLDRRFDVDEPARARTRTSGRPVSAADASHADATGEGA